MSEATIEMPRYQCHKRVWALKIANITREVACAESVQVNEVRIICGEPERLHNPTAARFDVGMDHNFTPATFDVPGAIITPADKGYAPFKVSDEYLAKHKPEVGGYFVQYEDRYKSYSPAKAFEDGYTRI